MRTRRGLCYPRAVNNVCSSGNNFANTRAAPVMKEKRRRDRVGIVREQTSGRKKTKLVVNAGDCDFLDVLPDDLVLSILSKLSSSATCPSDFTNVLLTYASLFSLYSILYLLIPFLIFSFTYSPPPQKKKTILEFWSKKNRI